jgi:hypothetical protein
MKLLSNRLIEKGAVDACLYIDRWLSRAYAVQTVADKCICVIGVMDITGSVMNIEDLVCLGNCTKQWVVATCLPSFSY